MRISRPRTARWPGCGSSAAIGRPVTFALTQNDHDPDAAPHARSVRGSRGRSVAVRPQVAGRPVTLLLGLQTFHPFAHCPSWAAVSGETPAAKAVRMQDPELRRRLLAEVDAAIEPMRQFLDPDRAFPMSAHPNYEPGRETSIAARARAEHRAPTEVFYDVLMDDGGMSLVLRPLLNYTELTRRRAHDARAPVERGVSATVARTAARRATRARRRSC